MLDPEHVYLERLALRKAAAEKERAAYRTLGTVRLVTFVAGGLAIWAADQYTQAAWFGLAPLLLVLIALIAVGAGMQRRIRFAERAVAWCERGLERVRTRRNNSGETGDRFADSSHPYSLDLDLFGKHSLFQLLSVCRTRAGENTLAAWLLAPASAEIIAERHQAIEDLRPRLDLREDLAVLGEDFRSGVHPDALSSWAVSAPLPVPAPIRVVAAALSGIAFLLLVAWALTQFVEPRVRIALVLVGLVEGAVFFRYRALVSHIAHDAEEPAHDLALLAAVLGRIERESFASPRLLELAAALRDPRASSAAIHQLNRLMELLESRDNLFVRVFGPLILWTTQVSFAVEAWRVRHGSAIPAWLAAVAEIEALSSLASYSYEHPDEPFAEISAETPVLEATGLAHPLLAACVSNDVTMHPGGRLLIVSGSNMSGKSTLLRTVGTNTVLALAGAPIRATRLRVSTLWIGASIRTTDSLEGGISRFYAEILRIRQVLGRPTPVLFLLDELLAGTNSHDRRIGAAAILRHLLDCGGIGLATTHDLALSTIAGDYAEAQNVHFEDFLEDGQMHFDYRMRPGVVTRSNALELMRSVGLDV